jgi:hypothetical protein
VDNVGPESISTISARMAKPVKHSVTSYPIERQIRVIRGQKVMLGTDLAALYEVPRRVLNQAVRRNLRRFPEEFMFQLTTEEASALAVGALDRGCRGAPAIVPAGESVKRGQGFAVRGDF